jgi:hypothetical protein
MAERPLNALRGAGCDRQLVVAGACRNRTYRGSNEPQLVLKTSRTTRPEPPPRFDASEVTSVGPTVAGEVLPFPCRLPLATFERRSASGALPRPELDDRLHGTAVRRWSMVVGVVDLKQKAIAGVLVIALDSLSAAPPCSAQTSYEVSPFIGVYLQTAITEGGGPCLWICLSPSPPTAIYQDDALALGARVTARTSKRLAIDFSFGHWRSDIGSTSTTFTSGSLGLLFRFNPPDSGVSFFVVGGLSFVAVGGAAYTGPYPIGPPQTDWGPLLGVGARVAFSSTISLRVEAEDHLYTLTGWAASNHEHALVLSAGPSVRLTSRRQGAAR